MTASSGLSLHRKDKLEPSGGVVKQNLYSVKIKLMKAINMSVLQSLNGLIYSITGIERGEGRACVIPRCAIAHRGCASGQAHTHCRAYGFSDVPLHIKARASRAPE
jgi:hypothetical protein